MLARGSQASGPAARSLICPKQGKAAARLKQAIDTAPHLCQSVGGQLLASCTTLQIGLLESQGERFGASPAPFGLGLVVVDEVSDAGSYPGQAPCSKPCPGASPQPAAGEIPDQLRPVDPGAILCALDQPEQRRGLGEPPSHSPTTYRKNQGAIAAVANSGLRQGEIARPCSINSSSWEPTTTSPGCACAPPRLAG